MGILDRVKKLCSDRDISVGDLEKELELSNGSIYKWIKTTPGAYKVEKVADYFNVSVDYLLGKVPFKNEDETVTSICIASVRYVMNNRADFDPVFTRSTMDYYFDLFYESNNRLCKYIDRLFTLYKNRDNRITDLEYFELSNILFKDIKYDNKNYDGLIYLIDFNDVGGAVKLDLNEIPKFTKQSIEFNNSLLYKIRDKKEDDYITYTSIFSTVKTNINNVETDKIIQNLSHEALAIAEAYESATTDKKTIVRLTLGISNTHSSFKPYLLPNAAHEIEGASYEDKAHDEALMDDDDL